MDSFRLHQISFLRNVAIIIFYTLCIVHLGDTVILPFPIEISAEYEFDLQIQIPYSIILPGWPGQTRYRRRRDIQHEISSARKRLMAVYKVNSVEKDMASQVDSFFLYMGLEDTSCQQRLLCLIVRDPKRYSPLSEVLLQHLQPLYHKLQNSNLNSSSPLWRYIELYEAGSKGFLPETNCTQETIECSKHPDNNIDWSMLKTIKTLMQFVKLQFN